MADGPVSYRSDSVGVVARFDFPGAVQKVYISSEIRMDSPRGTTGSRPPSGVPRATLLFVTGLQRLTGYSKKYL
ncbi:hypothetical protein TNCT_525931 [Trichonephila clavata]|uniref:Uncharacterized protein n=1 Tax=Trichonephila clavata TaxID=2740835 RepID=A0A8X6HZU8_TRICU|nr:hypothetical protein TNCT_525931 [Trichonephila clavata]